MRRRIALSIALAVSVVLLSLMSSASTAQAQQPQRFRADTGVLTLGPNQMLRVTATLGVTATHEARVRFRWMRYVPAGCSSDGVCRQTVTSQGATQPETLGPADALHYDNGDPGPAIRVAVESSSRNVRAVFQIIDASTGEVVATFSAGQETRMDQQ